MKILVAVVNYGTKNDGYLHRLLQEYAAMPWTVDVVVLSNVSKPLPHAAELRVVRAPGAPETFAFVHREVLAERSSDYDLFVYSEDDTLLTASNIRAFVEVNRILGADEVPGFMRSECSSDGGKSISTLHGPFRWDPNSIVVKDGLTFATVTNHHSGLYVLTREQLRRAIVSGGFLVAPHHGRYAYLETAATDPYTQAGLKKVVCLSRIDEFVLPHLPNKYVGTLGVSEGDFKRQLHALEDIRDGLRMPRSLLHTESGYPLLRWSKEYYEPPDADVISLVPESAARILSYGCGSGQLEQELIRRGARVTGIPLDSVIAECAAARGVEIADGGVDQLLSDRAAHTYDCIVVSNLLHLVQDPDALLRLLRQLLTDDGTIIARLPNTQYVRVRARKGHHRLRSRDAGAHVTPTTHFRRWFTNAGLRIGTIRHVYADRMPQLCRVVPTWFASEFLVAATPGARR